MRRALEALEAESGPMLRVSIYWNALADLCLMAGELEEAESAIRTALQRSSQEKSVVCGDNWLMLSAIQQSKQQLEAARRSASEALRIYQEQGHQHGVAQAEVRIASLAETS
jgi:Flp pilus assembly protein TadD